MSNVLEYRLNLVDAKKNPFTMLYRPHISELVWEKTHQPADLRHLGFYPEVKKWQPAVAISPEQPGKKVREKLHTIKIQLGLKCNYACAYCSQASQPHDLQGNLDDVSAFLENLSWLDDGSRSDEGAGLRFEPWGGEPLVYWKQLQKLIGGLKTAYPKASFNMVTNASILTDEMIAWIDDMGLSIGISHDGAAYETQRGPDPLKDPQKLAMIRKLYNRLAPFGRIGFNCVLTLHNMSVDDVRDYIAEKLGVPPEELSISTEGALQPYDPGGMMMSPVTPKDHDAMRHSIYFDYLTGLGGQVSNFQQKVIDFYRSLAFGRPWLVNGQKCGMDDEGTIAVDLKGNVMTCQNTSADTYHKIGHTSALEDVKLNTSWHMSKRDECSKCPVVQLCKGACMFNTGPYWKQGCDNSYDENTAILAVALFFITKGLILESIDGPVFRRDSFGTRSNIIDVDLALSKAQPVGPSEGVGADGHTDQSRSADVGS